MSHLGSRAAFPPADVSLELEAALLVSSQLTPPSALVVHVDGLLVCLSSLLVTCWGEQLLSLRMSSRGVVAHEFAFDSLQTRRMLYAVN